jgi:hypothetical protein
MRARLPRALLAVAALPGALFALSAVPTATPTTSTRLAPVGGGVLRVRVPAGLASRLRAAGLDPSDPQLSQKLKQRFTDVLRRGGRRTGIRTQTGLKRGGAPVYPLPAGLARGRTSSPSGPASLEIQQFFLSAWDVYGTLKVKAPGAFSPGQITYRLTEPTCGLDVSGAFESHGVFCCGYDKEHVEWMSVQAYPSKAFIFGGKGRSVTMTVTASGLPTATKVFQNVWGRTETVTLTLTIDAAPPHLPANEFGIGAANAQFGGAGARSSTGEPWTSTSGEDTIGLGVNLGAGYTVTSTKITAVHSQLDPPGYSAPENAYRYAKIKTPPGGGRLQTVVEWMYGPAESLTYTIEWVLGGPMGQRPLSTMPSAGPCDVN